MGKMKIRLLPDGTIQMETEGIKGKKCMDYAKVLERLADAKIYHMEKTEEFYQQEILELDETQRLRDT
ncbi:MAG: DUF2997 domain-containing protein [Candidatus Gastranaerophilales bacterium]|nr:DUF2997 domain-containing protein [Candidatus Gastranaerophilales bacterium]